MFRAGWLTVWGILLHRVGRPCNSHYARYPLCMSLEANVDTMRERGFPRFSFFTDYDRIC